MNGFSAVFGCFGVGGAAGGVGLTGTGAAGGICAFAGLSGAGGGFEIGSGTLGSNDGEAMATVDSVSSSSPSGGLSLSSALVAFPAIEASV
jgi:hypothetical protein